MFSTLPRAWPLALSILWTAAATAQVTTSVIPLAPHGDAIGYVAGAPLPLTVDSLLLSVQGADGIPETADDVTLLIEGLGGVPSVTPLATPFVSTYSPRMERLSATRALLPNAGPDGLWETADDGVFLLDDLGGANSVTPITTGGLWTGDAYSPARIDAASALLSTEGPDLLPGTADDTVAYLSDLGGANTVTQLTLGSHFIGGANRPVVLGPTSFLLGSFGPDGFSGSADDETILVTDLGGTNAQTPLATPFLNAYAGSIPVPLSVTRTLVLTRGPDANTGTADDTVFLLDDLAGAPSATPIAVPFSFYQGGSGIAAVDARTALLSGEGPDGTELTADDEVAVLSDLGGSNTVTPVTVGFLSDEHASHPQPLGGGRFALASQGVDAAVNTADDELIVLSDVGGANALTRIPIPGLADRITSRSVALSPEDVLITSGGADGAVATGSSDDVVSWIRAPLGAATIQEIAASEIPDLYHKGFSPHPLGNGRAVLLDAGADLGLEGGGDDGLRVIAGLPAGVHLAAQKITVKFDAAKPDKGEKVSAKAELLLPEPDLFPGEDLTVRVGNAAQTIPAGSFVLKKNKWTYKDKKGDLGFLRKVTWHPEKGKLSVKGKGLTTGAETTSVDNVVLSLESRALYAAQSVGGETKKGKIVYKAPK